MKARLPVRTGEDPAGKPFSGPENLPVPRIDTPPCGNQNTRLVFAEGYPSGQREQTVNLPAYAFVGSNPTPSTKTGRFRH